MGAIWLWSLGLFFSIMPHAKGREARGQTRVLLKSLSDTSQPWSAEASHMTRVRLFQTCSFVITLYLLWLSWVFTAACGLSLFVGNAGYSSFAATGLSSWWLLLVQSWGPRCMGPVAVVCSFSCSKACGILDPGPGIETVFFALAGRFLTSGRPGRSSDSLL